MNRAMYHDLIKYLEMLSQESSSVTSDSNFARTVLCVFVV
jgi:hypothetical protein